MLRVVLRDLRRIARARLAGERDRHTLQPTELVNEVYPRLRAQLELANDTRHFFSLATEAMKQFLIDYQRRRDAAKRPSLEYEEDPVLEVWGALHLVDIERALDFLTEKHPRVARVILLQAVGLSHAEKAQALDVSVSTIEKDLAFGRAKLHSFIQGE